MKPVLLIDFGSTYTKVTVADAEEGRLLGTAAAFTTVETDINEGLHHALARLEQKLGPMEYDELLACSSAAGGLRMAASGLVPELTAKAARTASLGAGAKVIKVYAFDMTEEDILELEQIHPDLFLLAGGTDGGNSDCVLHNAAMLAGCSIRFPIVYAGNRTAAKRCKEILKGWDFTITENVMPQFNCLNIEKAQGCIRDLFLKQIIEAKGMTKARELISGIMMPTPSAVQRAMKLLAEGCPGERGLGELLGVDVGGATTDVYSIADGRPINDTTVVKGLPEPYMKRTVEGDIGMRYSAAGILEACGAQKLARLSGLSEQRVAELAGQLAGHASLLAEDERDLEALDYALACMAVEIGVLRHAGSVEQAYTMMGAVLVQNGKDLTSVRNLVMTGGSLIHSPRARQIAQFAAAGMAHPNALMPKKLTVYVDRHYILSAMGLLAERYPAAALRIMKKELEENGDTEQTDSGRGISEASAGGPFAVADWPGGEPGGCSFLP